MNEGFNMTDLEPGDLWDFPNGKRVEILDRAFMWLGIRWVAVFDHDWDSNPRLFKVTRFEGARRLES